MSCCVVVSVYINMSTFAGDSKVLPLGRASSQAETRYHAMFIFNGNGKMDERIQ